MALAKISARIVSVLQNLRRNNDIRRRALYRDVTVPAHMALRQRVICQIYSYVIPNVWLRDRPVRHGTAANIYQRTSFHIAQMSSRDEIEFLTQPGEWVVTITQKREIQTMPCRLSVTQHGRILKDHF